MAVLTGKARAALPDSAFAHIEPGHEDEKVDGRTPDKYRHYPVQDASHVRDALSRIAQGTRFAKEAKPKVLAAAKEHGVDHEATTETGRSLESLFPEVRFIRDAPELRQVEGGGDPHITGYAAVYGKLSRKLGGFYEVIDTRAFDQAAGEGFPGVVCRYNHRDDMVLGTTRGGTLAISLDERGMHYDVVPPKHRSDVLELVQRRDVQFSSFAFVCAEPGVDDTWGVSSMNQPLRTLHNVQVKDVAPVLDPAYFDTSAAARSMTGAVESLARWVDASADEVRSYLSAGQAIKFFKRSDRPSAPKVEVPSLDPASAEERTMLDDPAVALRNWRIEGSAPDEARSTETATQESSELSPEEQRARTAQFMDHEGLCRRYTHGQPCVRPQGHEDDCNGPCWGSKDGLPCSSPAGHDGDHKPMAITGSRSAEDEGVETRSADDEDATYLTEPEAEAASDEVAPCNCADDCSCREPEAPEADAAAEAAKRAMAEMERDMVEMRMRKLQAELA